MDLSRRSVLSRGLSVLVAMRAAPCLRAAPRLSVGVPDRADPVDATRMRELAEWTALTLATPDRTPCGAEMRDTKTGERLMRAANAVWAEHDPSAHAEVRTMRLACAKLKSASLKGYTLYTTCEPCPMCMSDALWAGVDRVVYGATIEDANKYCNQIRISAREVVERSDMKCVVDGPVEEAKCVELFADPRMIKAMAAWRTR